MLLKKLKIIVPILMVVAVGSATAGYMSLNTQSAESTQQAVRQASTKDNTQEEIKPAYKGQLQEFAKPTVQKETKIKSKTATSVSDVTTTPKSGNLDMSDWKIREALKDLRVAGYSEEVAMSILNKALLVNQKPREIYEIASGFVDMSDVGIPFSVASRIFDMDDGIDPKIFRKEISTLISDLIDMHEIGISSDTAIAALFMAIGADQSLREVSTIISGIIDMKESGAPEGELLTRAKNSITTDPSLRNFDDLLGINWDAEYDKDAEYE